MSKGLNITILVIIFIVIIALIFLYTNRGRIVNWAVEKSFGTMEKTVMDNRPRSIPPDSISTLFDRAEASLKSGEADQEKMQVLIDDFRNSLEDKELDSLEVHNILKNLEAIGK